MASPRPTLDTRRPFTVREALAAGIGRGALAGPSYVRLFRGVYLRAEVTPTAALLAEAALRVAPAGAIVARQTAAQLWGGVVPADGRVHLCVPPGSGHRRPDVRATRHRVPPPSRVVDGLPATSPEQTFCDLAPSLTLVDFVVLGDSLVARGVTRPEQLRAAAREAHTPGISRARAAAELVRTEVESPMETRLRLLLVLAGLPEPQVNHVLRDEGGGWVYRLDLAYPAARVAVEYDGRHHAESTKQWRGDVRRRRDLDLRGWVLLVALADDIYVHPGRFVDAVARLLQSRGVTARPGEGWRAHFPGRGR